MIKMIRLLCWGLLLGSLAGCVTYRVASKFDVGVDKDFFERLDAEFRAVKKKPLSWSLGLPQDKRLLRDRAQAYETLRKQFLSAYDREREAKGSPSTWVYASHYRAAYMVEQQARLFASLCEAYAKAGNKDDPEVKTLEKATPVLYQQAYQLYLFCMFLSHLYKRRLPGVETHDTAKDPWLKKAKERMFLMARRVPLSKLQQLTLVNDFGQRLLRRFRGKDVKMRAHVESFKKAYADGSL